MTRRGTVVVTGAHGFLGGYVVAALLEAGWRVIGVDDLSKYGPVPFAFQDHPAYRFVEGDAADLGLLRPLVVQADHFVAAAAKVGGIGYFHDFPYTILAANERLTLAAFEAALHAHRRGRLRKLTLISSSMVLERTARFPTPEEAAWSSPPPVSSYGFQKLALEMFARAAHAEHGLPYTILRPFNAIGPGERIPRVYRDTEGPRRLVRSHVIPDLVFKLLAGQDPLEILGDGRQVRHYTYAGDVAEAIVLSLEHPAATNEVFHVAHPRGHTVLEVAELLWRRLRPERPFRWRSVPGFPHDVQKRIPDVTKARRLLGFEARTPLETVLDRWLPWLQELYEEEARRSKGTTASASPA